MGADFPASYFERLVWEAIPMCEAEDLRCFVFDSRGYIITHPYLQLSGYQKSEEEQHLTHMVSEFNINYYISCFLFLFLNII